MIQMPLHELKGRHLLSMRDLAVEEMTAILDLALQFKRQPPQLTAAPPLCRGKIMASCFFEPSTRTRLSFEAAMKRLGGDVIGFAGSDTTSAAKGETLPDAMRIISGYADVIVLRHPVAGAAQLASVHAEVPLINAGDGSNEHPTQTLLDLFTMRDYFGRLHDLSIALVGDLRHGRTVHSLALALKSYGVRLSLVAPQGLELPQDLVRELVAAGCEVSEHRSIDEVIAEVDLIYMTRIQQERFEQSLPYEVMCAPYRLTVELIARAQPHLKVLHPLPRRSEIDPSVDSLPQAAYFEQAKNGLFVREALLSVIL